MLSKANKIAATVMLFSMTACSTLQPVAEPTTFLSQENPKFVVVTTVNQQEDEPPLYFNSPRFEEGKLSGLVLGENISIPVTSVKTLKARQMNKGRTTAALVAGGIAVGVIGYLIATGGDGYEPYECESPCRGIGNGARIPY